MALASSSTMLAQASASYKKKPGVLLLSKTALSWTATGQQKPELEVKGGKLKSLFSSKESSAKVMLRVGIEAPGADGAGEEHHNFTFTTASSAVSDREHFKREISTIIGRNRDAVATNGTKSSAGTPAGSGSSTPVPGGSATVAPNPRSAVSDFTLRRKVLERDPTLAALHRELVMTKLVTEAEFWDGREELLVAAGAEDRQKKGKSGVMVDPKPETSEKGVVTVKITPALIQEIFEEYPAVLRAYGDNVPTVLDTNTFWTRYFQSKLFNRNRTTNRAAVSTIKDDPIFDKYLDDEDDDIEPKNLKVEHIYRLLDLAATEEDQHEVTNQKDVTMRAGSQRSALPLMRRFNEHSERLLNASLGADAKRQRMGADPGNAGTRNQYYDDILLDDLSVHREPDRIYLDIDGKHQTTGGARDAGDSDDAAMQDADFLERVQATVTQLETWEPDLRSFELGHKAVRGAMEEMTANMKQKALRSSRDSHARTLPDGLLRQLTTLQASTNEFLRQFWSAVLPPKPNDLSAAARATPVQKAAKAEKMKGYLAATEDKVAKAVEGGKTSEQRTRIAAAMEPTMEAVKHALAFYASRTT